MSRHTRFSLLILGSLGVITALIWFSVFSVEARVGVTTIRVFDIGQGDAIFIEAPNGNQVLIDGGPDRTILSRLGEVLPPWDHTIDLIILTHPHADHLTGLIEVLERYDVAMVLAPKRTHSIAEYDRWVSLMTKKHVQAIAALRGKRIELGDDVFLDVLAPSARDAEGTSSNLHNAMVVIRFCDHIACALFTGDAERRVELELISSDSDLQADFLKIGHHGSKTSTSQVFLDAVRPKFAAISVGQQNRYGHPNAEVLERLIHAGIRVFRTDRDGTITLRTDGVSFHATSAR